MMKGIPVQAGRPLLRNRQSSLSIRLASAALMPASLLHISASRLA
jgi:hypothetical protein